MFLMSQDSYLILLLCIIIPIAILFIVAITLWIRRLVITAKKGKIANQEPLDNLELLSMFGGQENIVSVTKEMSRISVEVIDIEAVKAEKIKEYGASGILLVGNCVKCSFQELSNNIYEMLRRK